MLKEYYMALPYTLKNNNYYINPKNSTVYTPPSISKYLYDTINTHVSTRVILDPCIGGGSLTQPWRHGSTKIIGVDVDRNSETHCDIFIHSKFEDIKEWIYDIPDLIVCNPPFNGAKNGKLYSEVFLRHIVELFGNRIPVVLFVSMGFRLNQTFHSSRWNWLKNNMDISSIIALPYDCFDNVKFHSEILVFNIDGLKPHYQACA